MALHLESTGFSLDVTDVARQRGLTLSEAGLFFRLLLCAGRIDVALDPRDISRMVGCTQEEAVGLWPHVRACFEQPVESDDDGALFARPARRSTRSRTTSLNDIGAFRLLDAYWGKYLATLPTLPMTKAQWKMKNVHQAKQWVNAGVGIDRVIVMHDKHIARFDSEIVMLAELQKLEISPRFAPRTFTPARDTSVREAYSNLPSR